MSSKRRIDGSREAVAIDRQRAACRNLIGVGAAHDQGVQLAQLGMKQADSIVRRVIGAERIGTNEFGEAVGAMSVRGADRPHFMEHDVHTGVGDLPSGFGACKASANDVNGIRGRSLVFICHGLTTRAHRRQVQRARPFTGTIEDLSTRQRPREAGVIR